MSNNTSKPSGLDERHGESPARGALDRPLAIHVTDSSLMGLVVAGMESYHVRHWGKGVRKGLAETAGLLWGYVVPRNDMDHVVVDYVSTDTFAKGTANEVGLNDVVTEVKQRVIAYRWPHLTMVGDFHTHPYKRVGEVRRDRGWEFSDADRSSYGSPETWPGRMALVLTIAELGRSSDMDAEVVSDNVIHWQMDRYRFWLSGYSIDRCGTRLLVSPTPDKGRPSRPAVYVDAPTVNGTNSWFVY